MTGGSIVVGRGGIVFLVKKTYSHDFNYTDNSLTYV